MADATDDLIKQKQMAEQQKRDAERMIAQAKELKRKQVADLRKHKEEADRQLSAAQADLSKMG